MMTKLLVSGEKLINLITQPEGYVRPELKYEVLKWLNTRMTAFWYPNDNVLSDAIILHFDSDEDAMSFKLTWM